LLIAELRPAVLTRFRPRGKVTRSSLIEERAAKAERAVSRATRDLAAAVAAKPKKQKVAVVAVRVDQAERNRRAAELFEALCAEHGVTSASDRHIAKALARVLAAEAADPIRQAEMIARLRSLLPPPRASPPLPLDLTTGKPMPSPSSPV
jgi:hypothetical protein